jgi:hypothetical protein
MPLAPKLHLRASYVSAFRQRGRLPGDRAQFRRPLRDVLVLPHCGRFELHSTVEAVCSRARSVYGIQPGLVV